MPKENAEEAGLSSGLTVYAMGHLLELAAHLARQTPLAPFQANGLLRESPPYPDLAEVQGQSAAKRAAGQPLARSAKRTTRRPQQRWWAVAGIRSWAKSH